MRLLVRNILFVVLVFAFNVRAEDKKIEIGIDEQLGAKLPLDTEVVLESGEKAELKELFTKPTVFAFVYYECPAICSPLLLSIADVINNSDMVPGEDYNVITLSMDEYEDNVVASDKKRNYLNSIDKSFPENSWRFLTADSASIKKIADAAGFYFKREGSQFIHSGALIFVNSDGKISRYLFPNYSDRRGYAILPFDFKMAIIETSKGNTVPTVARMLQFCFSYDPEGKSYVLNATRLFGAGIVICAIIFVVVITHGKKKKKLENKS